MKFPIEVITTCVQRSVRYVEAESEVEAVAKIQQEIGDTVANKNDVYL